MAEPTRIPDFYARRFRSSDHSSDLTCTDCGTEFNVAGDDLPLPGGRWPCLGCGLVSRVPTLPSQAGMRDPVDPPHDERS
jgi:hypothetical protein